MSLIQRENEWASEIGNIFLSFGDIEFVTLECLRHFPTEDIYNSTSKLNFKPRVNLIIEIVNSMGISEKLKNEMTDLLNQAFSMSDKRNLIAHNPLALEVYEDSEGNYEFAEIIASLRNEKNTISFDGIKQLAVESSELSEALHSKFMEVKNEKEENS